MKQTRYFERFGPAMILALVVSLVWLSGCRPEPATTPQSSQEEELSEPAPDRKLSVVGSTTIMPISERWAAAYKEQTGAVVNVQGGGSTHGITLAQKGEVDIGAASRELSPQEAKGLDVVPIAKDALVIIVNKSNRQVDRLTLDQLRDIYAGEITNWQEVGGKDREIQVINREAGSGTRDTFEDMIMCCALSEGPQMHCAETTAASEVGVESKCEDTCSCWVMTLSAIIPNSNAEVKRTVALIKDSIGYVSYGFVDDSIKPLKLGEVPPSEDHIYSDRYPLSRKLFYVMTPQSHQRPMVQDYLEYVLSPQAQKMVFEEGFLPIKPLSKPQGGSDSGQSGSDD